MIRIFSILALLFFTTAIQAQELKFKVKGVQDTTVHLVKYIGSKMYYADTAALQNEVVTFDGSKQDAGIMALLLPGQKFFEFVYNDQPVHLVTEGPDFRENMKVKKSKENKLFYEYINFMKSSTDEARALNQKKAAIDPENKAELTKISAQLEAKSDEVKAYQKNLVKENPETFVSKVVKMSTDVEIPEPPRNKDGSLKDSAFQYTYFRDHYFDNIDLKDDRIANTPVFQRKLEYYYSKRMLPQQPDTLIKYLSKVVDQLEEGSEMYRFVVTNITSHYEKSKIMGMDKVVNHFIANYFCALGENGSPKGYWMDKEKLEEICKNTKKRQKLVQGEVPPNVILPDSTNQKWYNLHELEHDYIILYFWDPGCGHCKKVTPKLQKLYAEKLKDRNVEVFAVGKATGDDFEDWKAFIKKHGLSFINVGVTKPIYKQAQEDPRSLIPSKTTLQSINYQDTYDIYSTPRVWILDKDKKIVAKSLSIPQIERFLDRLQGEEDAEKLFELEEKKAEEAEEDNKHEKK